MKHKSRLVLPFVLAALPLCAHDHQPTAEEAPAEPTAETDPAVIRSNSSYGFGFNTGKNFQQQMSRFGLSSDDIDRDRFIEGFMTALNGAEPEGGQGALNAAMLGLRNQIQEREKIVAEKNLQAGLEFLEKNKEREGVITTESGLQYEILTAGEGEKHDGSEGAKFLVNYRGTLIDGTEFDASPEGSPVTMTLGVVPGFREALLAMTVGSKWKVYLKPDLAYGEQRRSSQIEPNSTLIFELELVEIQKAPPRPSAVSAPIQIPPAPPEPKSAE